MHLCHLLAVFQLFGREQLRTIGKVVTVKALDRILSIDPDAEDFEIDFETEMFKRDAEDQQVRSAGWMKTMVKETMKGQLEPLDGLTPDQRARQPSK